MKYSQMIYVLPIAAFALTGCEKFRGTLNVNSDLTIYNRHIAHRTAHFTPGSYSVKATLHPTQHLLELNAEGQPRVKLPIPSSLQGQDGPFYLPASEIQQDFDAKGYLGTRVYTSRSYTSTRSCVLGYHTVVSYYNRAGLPVYSTVPTYGVQNVVAHDETTTHTLTLQLVSPSTGMELANLGTENSDTSTVVDTVTSTCY